MHNKTIHIPWRVRAVVTLLAFVLLLQIVLTGCAAERITESAVVAEPESSASAAQPSSTESPAISIIREKELVLSEQLIPDHATNVEHIDGGMSFESGISFNATVEFYKKIIAAEEIDGVIDTVDLEALGVEACWKFDGNYDGNILSITVALSKAEKVGVAILY